MVENEPLPIKWLKILKLWLKFFFNDDQKIAYYFHLLIMN